VLALLLGAAGKIACAMPSAPVGMVESGAPSFVVLGPEAIGLSSSPTDLHLLPDGRILVKSQREIAFGDGVRWEAFRGTDGQGGFSSSQVAVDGDGRIFTGTKKDIARVDLGEDARWHLTPATTVPADQALPSENLINVAVFPDAWYWYGGSGAIVSWRPGQTARIIGHVGAIDRIITLGQQVFASSQASGDLYRLGGDGGAVRVSAESTLATDTVTCSAPFGPGLLLVGTNRNGLKLFDGTVFRDFHAPGLLSSGHRISDLCPAGDRFLAAAVDTVGIVFFDREGRIVQVLDRSLDHRLARVQRLVYAPNGVLWALLNDGVARVEFPSPVSHFEPLLASGLAYAKPLRHDGRLWLLVDGRALRAVYDPAGRLERFEEDMPPGRFLFTLSSIEGQLFAGNDAGIFVREESGWKAIAPGIANARVCAAASSEGLLYFARKEWGWIQRTPEGYQVRRIPMPGLEETYNALVDPAGVVWLELGSSRVGRMDLRNGSPKIEILGTRDGLFDGWVQIFVFDGVARFNMTGHLCRFDESTHRFIEERELLARFPEITDWNGRPTTDASGRLWFTAHGEVHVLSAVSSEGRRSVETVRIDFESAEFTMEDNGVVWMWGSQRLARFDPRLPSQPADTLRAMITSVQFAASSRQLFAPGPTLGRLPYADNSLVVHFAAPANPFGASVNFDVMLEGAVTQWVSTGNVGSAAFSRLKEGDYVFHVRPVAGATVGTEARLAFTVRPPWYRTPLAWILYVLGALGIVVFAAWLSSFLERREKVRLERVVTERTRELNATNAQLGRQIAETTEKSAALSVSEERYRTLNAELEQRVEKRTAELSQRNTELFQGRQLLRILIDNLPMAIYAKDTACRKTLANPADLKNLRCASESDALGKTDFDFFPPEVARMFVADDQTVLETGRPVLDREEFFFDAEGHKHWLLTNKLPLRNQGGEITGLVGIGQDITSLKETEQKMESLHRQLLLASRTAGMAEVATGVLHNVGNVLNSVNVSAGVVAERLRTSKADGVAKLGRLLREQGANLVHFLTEDDRGRKVPAYVEQLAEHLAQERAELDKELKELILNVDHIKEIVAMQQNYARVSGVVEMVNLSEMVEDAFKIHGGAYARHGITVERDYDKLPTLSVDKHALLQIVVNLLHNAKYACEASNRADKRVTVRAKAAGPDRVKVEVTDNGIGIPPENITRIFSQGFTTRKDGHGFGLHSGALAAKHLGGTLTVQSAGVGCGATFTLELPLHPPAETKKVSD
jgi:PAS domain S-box-containing protein